MRKIILGATLLFLSTGAFAQMGGGMGGMGGMGGGMGGSGMGGMGGGRRGMGHGDGEEQSVTRGGTGPHANEIKPVKREKLDKPVEEMFKEADTNHDGMVTLDELKALLVGRRDAIIRARFEKVDTNHDKVIDANEFIAWQTAMGSVATSDEEVVGDRGGPVAETIAPRLGDDPDARVLRRVIEPLSATVIVNANTNYDRGLSLDELLAYERKRFDDADKDKDGWLSGDEIQALMGPRRGGRGFGGPGGGSGDGSPPPPPSGRAPD